MMEIISANVANTKSTKGLEELKVKNLKKTLSYINDEILEATKLGSKDRLIYKSLALSCMMHRQDEVFKILVELGYTLIDNDKTFLIKWN